MALVVVYRQCRISHSVSIPSRISTLQRSVRAGERPEAAPAPRQEAEGRVPRGEGPTVPGPDAGRLAPDVPRFRYAG